MKVNIFTLHRSCQSQYYNVTILQCYNVTMLVSLQSHVMQSQIPQSQQ